MIMSLFTAIMYHENLKDVNGVKLIFGKESFVIYHITTVFLHCNQLIGQLNQFVLCCREPVIRLADCMCNVEAEQW